MLKKLLSLLLSLLIVSATIVIANVPVSAAESAGVFNQHSYQLFDIGMEWDEASSYCEQLGGHLVCITSQEEQNYVLSLLEEGTRNSYWIGGFKSNSIWNWVTGESFSYRNWSPGQPDNYTSYEENGLMMYNNKNPYSNSVRGSWNDLNKNGTCNGESFFGLSNFGFICEWDSQISNNANGEKVSRVGDVIYYDNSGTKFSEVYCYMWYYDTYPVTSYNQTWPGERMTNIGNDIWEYKVTGEYNWVIFSDRDGNDGYHQTDDLKYPGSGKIAYGYYVKNQYTGVYWNNLTIVTRWADYGKISTAVIATGQQTHYQSGNTVTVKTENNSNLNIELEEDLKFTVPSNIPIIGGREIKLDLSFVPVTASVSNNKIRIGFGYNRDLTKEKDEQVWCNFKNYVDKYKSGIAKEKKLWEVSKLGIASAGMGTDFDFEFYGYFEGVFQNGEVIGSGNAKLKLEAAIKNEWQTAIAFIPIVVKAKGKVGAENTSTLSLNLNTKKVSFANDLDITLPSITASAGVGIAHVADVSIYGELKNVISIKSSPRKIMGTLFGEIGGSVKALMFSAKKAFIKINDGEGWTYYDSSKKSKSSYPVGSLDFTDVDFEIDRSYLDTQSAWLSKPSKAGSAVGDGSYGIFNYTTLQTSLYDGAAPKLIQAGSDLIMIWTGDDAARSDGNQTVVYYSVYNSENDSWSNPAAVEDNGTADCYPDIATDGENTFVVWTDAKTTLDSDVTMEEMAAACEIKLAKFNPGTKTFENITQLTDNSTLDFMPKVSVKDGKAHVAWKNNSANSLIESGGTDMILLAKQSGESFAISPVYSTDKMIYELALNGESLAFTADGDGDSNTTADTELYTVLPGSNAVKLTDNESGEYNLRFSRIDNNTVLTYQRDGVVYGSKSLTSEAALSDGDVNISGEYQFVADKLYSVESEDESAEIYSYSKNGADKWSNPVQISKTGEYLRHVSFAESGEDVRCVFLKSSAEITEDDVIETTDLCSAVIPEYHEIQIDDVYYDSEDVEAGKTVPVTVTVTNKGTAAENYYKLSLTDDAGNVVSEENYFDPINSGETKELEINLPLDSELNGLKSYTVTAYSNQSSDTTAFSLGYTQLSLTTDVGIQNGSLGIIANVVNDSSISTGAALKIKESEDGEALDTFYLGEIGGKERVSYFVDNETISGYKAQTDMLYFELVSYKDEEALADNTDIVGISDISSFLMGDVNLDGKVDIRDVTEIQKRIAKLVDFTSEQSMLADTDNSGSVNIIDATWVQKYIANKF